MDMSPRYVKVTETFDPNSFDGALVLLESLQIGACFPENGYDEGNPEGCRVIEVRPLCKNPANDEALRQLFAELGIDLNSGEWEDTLSHAICNRPHVRAALEAKGYDGVHTRSMVLHNGEYDAIFLWKPDTFEVVPQPEDVRDFSVEETDDGRLALSLNTAEGARKLIDWGWQEDEAYDGIRAAFAEAIEGHNRYSLVDPARVGVKDDAIVIGEDVVRSDEGPVVAGRFWVIKTPALYEAEYSLLEDRRLEVRQELPAFERSMSMH
jgi:hypothetical protein